MANKQAIESVLNQINTKGIIKGRTIIDISTNYDCCCVIGYMALEAGISREDLMHYNKLGYYGFPEQIKQVIEKKFELERNSIRNLQKANDLEGIESVIKQLSQYLEDKEEDNA